MFWMACASLRISCRRRALSLLLLSLFLPAQACSSSQHARSAQTTAGLSPNLPAELHRYSARHLLVPEPNGSSSGTIGKPGHSSDGSSSSKAPTQTMGWQWDLLHVGALITSSVNFFVAAATGQGGTSLLIPIFTSMLRMSVGQAVSCAVFAVFLGSIPSFWHALTMEHPYDTDHTLIDYRTMSILTPAMLLGIKAGVTLNKMCPDWFVSFLLMITYTLSTLQQTRNMIKLRAQEARLARAIKQVEQDVAELEVDSSSASILVEAEAPLSLTAGEQQQQQQQLQAQLFQEEKRRQKLLQLECSIQQIAELSRDISEKEAYTLPPTSLKQSPITTIQSALSRQHWPSGDSPRARLLTSATMGRPYQLGLPHQHTGFTTVLSSQHTAGNNAATSAPVPAPRKMPRLAAMRCSSAPSWTTYYDQHQIRGSQNLGPDRSHPDGRDPTSYADQQHQSSTEHPQLLSGLTEDQIVHLGQLLSSLSPSLRASLPQGRGLRRFDPGRWSFRESRARSSSPSLRGGSFPGARRRGSSPVGSSPAGPSPVGSSPRSSHAQGGSSRLSSMPVVREGLESTSQHAPAANSAAAEEAAARAAGADPATDGTAALFAAGAGPALGKLPRSSSSVSNSSSGLDSDNSSIDSLMSPFHAAQLPQPPPLVQQTEATQQMDESHCHQQQQQQPDAQVAEESISAVTALQTVQQSAGVRNRLLGISCCCCCSGRKHSISTQHKHQPGRSNPLRSLVAAVQSWWRKQPRLLLVLITLNFVAYCLLCLAWGWLPKCHVGFYVTTAAYIAATIGLAAWMCWLHWPKGALHTVKQLSAHSLDCSGRTVDLELGNKDSQQPASAVLDSSCHKASEHSDALAQEPTVPESTASPDLCVFDMFREVEWTRIRLLYFQPLMLVIGVVSGLLGASPNTLFLAPMLVTMGQHPQVSSATLKLALFISTASSSTGYLVNGQLDISHGLAFGIANLLITPMGQWVMDVWIRKTGRSSLILVAGVLRNIVALPMLAVFNVVPGVLDLIHHQNTEFHGNMCH